MHAPGRREKRAGQSVRRGDPRGRPTHPETRIAFVPGYAQAKCAALSKTGEAEWSKLPLTTRGCNGFDGGVEAGIAGGCAYHP